jgi:phage terminase large subunit GpA-like protein
MADLTQVRREALACLYPPVRLTLSDWVEANVYLPQGLAAMSGPMRLWPFQRELADSIGDPGVERVSILKATRVGYTALLASVIAHHVINDPTAVLCLQPVESDARDFTVSDLEPLFEASPSLRGRLKPPSRRPDERSTILHRMFPGGSLKVVAAKAPRNLRRHTARILLVDEADAMEITREGDAVALAEKRTLSFRNRKIVVGSTPADENTSSILRLYQDSDMRVFELACPFCQAPFELLWRHITWPEAEPEQAYCTCPACEGRIEEREHKGPMVEAGRWRATRPEIRGHRGYRLNALISPLPNASWGRLATEFLQAKHDADLLRVFTTTLLAEPWRSPEEALDENDLTARVEAFDLERIPEPVLVLCAGVDIQDDRTEVSILGFDRAGTTYVLDHTVLYGKPLDAGDPVWTDLDDHLRRRFVHPRGGTIGIDAAVVDASDGDSYNQVLTFCATRLSRKVLAGKGAAGLTRPPLVSAKRSRGRGRLFIVGVDPLKSRILSMLASRAKLIRFSHTLAGGDSFNQLTSERKVTRMSRGRPVVRFERRQGARCEALDCAVYALAARASLSLDLNRRESELAAATSAPPAPKRPSVIPSNFMSR